MRWRQALLAATIAVLAAAYADRRLGFDALEAGAVTLLVYVAVRILIAAYYRTQYWRGRENKRQSRSCGNCGQYIYRRRGDLFLRCGRCGWTAGWPGTRWLTRSVPVRQLRRSVTWQRLGAIVLAITVITLSAALGPFSIPSTGVTSASDDGSTPKTSTPSAASPADINETAVERLIFEKINDRRAERSMKAYSYNERAAKAAEEHARHMARNDYFSHTEPNGETQQERYSFCDGGENIAQTWVFRTVRSSERGTVRYTTAPEVASGLVAQWMHSQPHRERGIYGEWWTSAGVGVSIKDSGEVYAVTGFCT